MIAGPKGTTWLVVHGPTQPKLSVSPPGRGGLAANQTPPLSTSNPPGSLLGAHFRTAGGLQEIQPCRYKKLPLSSLKDTQDRRAIKL